MPTLPDTFSASERGNTFLVSDDSGSTVAWIGLPDGSFLEIADTPGNHPRLHVVVTRSTPEQIRAHVVENLEGWRCVRWNLDGTPPVDGDQIVIG